MRKRLKELLISTRMRVLIFLVLNVALFVFSNVYSIMHGLKYEEQFDDVLTKYYTINSFMTTYSNNTSLLELYFSDKSEAYWLNYVNNDAKVKQLLKQMVSDAKSMPVDSFLLIQSIKNTYGNYDDLVHSPVDPNQEIRRLLMIKQASNLIMEYTGELLETSLSYGTQAHEKMKGNMIMEQRIALVMMLVAAEICIASAGYMIKRVLDPIGKLSDSVDEIARENFDIEDLPEENADEIGRLNRAVNEMKRVMNRIIFELNEKQVMNQKLHQQKIRIMNSEKMLGEARFSFLQSQINPHFLFNTLNTISGTARMEQAKVTDELIRSLSKLFRYTLDNKAQTVLLSQELSVIKSFIYIEKKRFGERLRYFLKVSVEPGCYYIPPFTLQPMVENSIRHGILVQENGGFIAVCILERDEKLIIKIIDNGVGMSRNMVQRLTAGKGGSGKPGGSGIGLVNVLERLRFIYPGCSIRIISRISRGTCIEIKLPLEECRHA